MIADLKPYPVMKDSRGQWLGEVPANWEARWIKTGYKISFTRCFYKPKPIPSLAEIRAEILALEKETKGLLEEVLSGGLS